MDIVDSNDRKLEGPEVLVLAANSNNGAAASIGNVYPPDVAFATIAQELNMPSADIRQYGNTVFIGHRGKGQNRNKMVGRALNVDTGRNFVNNSLEYIRYLQKRGITHYTTWFNGEGFLNAFRVFQRFTKGTDTQIGIGKRPDNGYIVYIRIGRKPIPESL